jgi:hypothetical protein
MPPARDLAIDHVVRRIDLEQLRVVGPPARRRQRRRADVGGAAVERWIAGGDGVVVAAVRARAGRGDGVVVIHGRRQSTTARRWPRRRVADITPPGGASPASIVRDRLPRRGTLRAA